MFGLTALLRWVPVAEAPEDVDVPVTDADAAKLPTVETGLHDDVFGAS